MSDGVVLFDDWSCDCVDVSRRSILYCFSNRMFSVFVRNVFTFCRIVELFEL